MTKERTIPAIMLSDRYEIWYLHDYKLNWTIMGSHPTREEAETVAAVRRGAPHIAAVRVVLLKRTVL